MSAGILIANHFDIPPGIDTLDDFRRWVHSENFPEEGRIDWVDGKLEIETSPDNIFWHSSPKSEMGGALHSRIKRDDLGLLVIDKTRIVIPHADVSSEPDIVFVSHESIRSRRVSFIPTVNQKPDSYLEIEGPPDLVVEVVSDGSVTKDTQRLFTSYFDGGVEEYWLVDARGAELLFQIYKRGSSQYVPTESNAVGYQKSHVLDTWYRFTRERGQNDLWRYDLAERA